MTRLSSKKIISDYDEAPVNPMDSVSNLADAMLVLAVGIMLALIVNWNVDITVSKEDSSEGPVEFEEQDMQEVSDDSEVVDGGDLEEMGTVYYDSKSGTYYIMPKE